MQGAAAGWAYAEELAAATVDRLGEISYLLRAAHFKGPHTPPVPIPRPGDGGRGEPAAAKPKMSSHAEIMAFFGGPATKVGTANGVADGG